tara:strand:+ start:13412 stop:14329 length:918 start_codon:yes stop_codon:yes gene_type:complete
MAQITASLVKELREKSGAGMMDCKNALQENDANIEKSIDWLRAKGITKAAKKSDRIASEGLVGSLIDQNRATLVELNSETDFVARNEDFQNLLRGILSVSIENENVLSSQYPNSERTVEEEINEKIATIGENIMLRRVQNMSIDNGFIYSYTHNTVSDSLGKIGVLLAIETSASSKQLEDFGKNLCMHIAAASPIALSAEGVSREVLDREREIALEQAKESGKPESIAEKMVEGRIKKFTEENALLSQVFVIDGQTKILELVDHKAKEIKHPIKIVQFIRMQLGEGVEKKEEDFASEVASVANKN